MMWASRGFISLPIQISSLASTGALIHWLLLVAPARPASQIWRNATALDRSAILAFALTMTSHGRGSNLTLSWQIINGQAVHFQRWSSRPV